MHLAQLKSAEDVSSKGRGDTAGLSSLTSCSCFRVADLRLSHSLLGDEGWLGRRAMWWFPLLLQQSSTSAVLDRAGGQGTRAAFVSGSCRLDSVSLSSPAFRDCLCALAHGPILHFQKPPPVTSQSLCLSPPAFSSTFKNFRDDIGPTRVIQDTFSF